MELKVMKLATAYERRVDYCDNMLSRIVNDIAAARDKCDKKLEADLQCDQREWDARRTAYVQCKYDIKSILGEMKFRASTNTKSERSI